MGISGRFPALAFASCRTRGTGYVWRVNVIAIRTKGRNKMREGIYSPPPLDAASPWRQTSPIPLSLRRCRTRFSTRRVHQTLVFPCSYRIIVYSYFVLSTSGGPLEFARPRYRTSGQSFPYARVAGPLPFSRSNLEGRSPGDSAARRTPHRFTSRGWARSHFNPGPGRTSRRNWEIVETLRTPFFLSVLLQNPTDFFFFHFLQWAKSITLRKIPLAECINFLYHWGVARSKNNLWQFQAFFAVRLFGLIKFYVIYFYTIIENKGGRENSEVRWCSVVGNLES